ncbi:MAG: hypothetical protein WC600_05380 [Desulfobaccales bacterium]
MAVSNFSAEIPGPWPTTSSSTIIAGAAGRPAALYASLWYSSLDLETASTSIAYFSPNLGMISWRRFQVMPQGSFKKILILSISSPLIHFLVTVTMRDNICSGGR